MILTELRELVIEARASGVDPREFLKIANLVLLAPGLDVEVTGQRAMAEGLPFAVGRVTICINKRNVALALSKQLFASGDRLGELDPEEITDAQEERLEEAGNIDVVFYSGGEGGTLQLPVPGALLPLDCPRQGVVMLQHDRLENSNRT